MRWALTQTSVRPGGLRKLLLNLYTLRVSLTMKVGLGFVNVLMRVCPEDCICHSALHISEFVISTLCLAASTYLNR